MNFGIIRGIVCVLHRLTKAIGLCKPDQINADPNGKWGRLAREKIDQQIGHGSECSIKTGPKKDKKCYDGQRIYKMMLFVADSVQLDEIQPCPYPVGRLTMNYTHILSDVLRRTIFIFFRTF